MKWILKHFKLVLAIVMFGVTAIVVSMVMISSFTDYKNYEKTYYANDLEVRSASAAAPKTVEINDKFKSQYKKSIKAEASEYTTDGNVLVELKLEEKSFADLDFYFNYGETENLLENMNIKVNGSLIEDDHIKVETKGEEAEWHHLVMSSFALPEGSFIIEVQGVKGKEMPEIGTIAVFTSAAVSFAA